MNKRILAIFLCMMLALSATACGQKKTTSKKDDSKINLYYTNEAGDTLIAEKHEKSKKKKLKDQVNQTYDWLANGSEMTDEEYPSITSNIQVNSIDVEKHIARVDFAVGYEKNDTKENLICRAAITKTLTQIDGIDYVEFLIGGTTMTDTDGTPIGALNADSFLFDEIPMEDNDSE